MTPALWTSLRISLSGAFVCLTLVGIGLVWLQWFLARRWLRVAPAEPTRVTPISILKPLCGVDDDLARNLEQFAAIDYPDYEVLLGVKNTSDPAHAVAVEAVKQWPDRFRLFIQRGEVGLNPKVNQLCTLVREAKHEIILVSDSNVRVPRGYLSEIAAAFEDPTVAGFTNPLVGIDERRIGSVLDAIHLGCSIGSGMIAAKMANGHSIMVGKSMALRKTDLAAMGGFEAAANHLAEDYVIGGRIHQQLNKRVVLGRLPVFNVSHNRSLKDFLQRYLRWSIIHRTAIRPLTYVGQQLMNPLPGAITALVLRPTRTTGALFVATWISKSFFDLSAAKRLRGHGFGWVGLFAVALKDVLISICWFNGMFARTVNWRGNQLRVLQGSRLVPLDGSELPAPQPDLVPAPVVARASNERWASERSSDRSVA